MLATAAMGDWITADEILIAVALDSWKPTQGTRLTGNKNPGPRSVYTNGMLVPLQDPPPSRSWHFVAPGEIFNPEEFLKKSASEVMSLVID